MNASLVKELRDKTNAGMMDCKQALMETNGDLDAAIEVLRKKGIAKASKKSDREASEGVVAAVVAGDAKSGVLLEVNCETDFVARNSDFQALVDQVGQTVLAAAQDQFDASGTLIEGDLAAQIKTQLAEAVAKMGENLSFHRAVRFNAAAGTVASYIHLGGKIGVLIEFSGSDANQDEIMKDICLHVAAVSPQYLVREEVPADILEKEKDVIKAQIKGKPDNIVDKIVAGKIDKFYSDNCLLEQGFVKDPDKTIKTVLGGLGIVRYAQFQLGA